MIDKKQLLTGILVSILSFAVGITGVLIFSAIRSDSYSSYVAEDFIPETSTDNYETTSSDSSLTAQYAISDSDNNIIVMSEMDEKFERIFKELQKLNEESKMNN